MKNNWLIWGIIIVAGYIILNDDNEPTNHKATNHYYDNSVKTANQIPPNATAFCRDGTYSYSTSRSGTCSHHGGVKYWLNDNQTTPLNITTHTYAPPAPTQNHTANTQLAQNPYDTTESAQNIHQNEQPTFTVEQAKQMYEQEIYNINQAWQKLNPEFRESIRLEQRAINNQRESECTAYGKAQSNDSDIARAYRYLCEVPRLKDRTKYLQQQPMGS